MSEPKEIKIYICMNEDGYYDVDVEAETAVEKLNDNYGGEMRRTVCITTTMSPPTILEVTAPAIPDDAGTTGPMEVE